MTADATRVRRGLPADAPALAALAARTFAETFAAQNDPEHLRVFLEATYGIDQQTQELEDPNLVTLLAQRGDVLVGFAQVRRGPAPPCVTQAHPVELQRFYVDRPAQGTGLAHRLMTAVRETAIELGGEHLWLGVWELNPRAIAFYRKEGFVEVGTTDFYVGPDRQTDRVMVIGLAPSPV